MIFPRKTEILPEKERAATENVPRERRPRVKPTLHTTDTNTVKRAGAIGMFIVAVFVFLLLRILFFQTFGYEKYRDKVKPDRVRRNAEIGVCMKCCAAPVIPGRKVCADCYTKLVDGLKAITLKRNKDVRFLPTDILMQRAVDMGEAIYGRTV